MFSTVVEIDNNKYSDIVHIVPNEAMNIDVIIGNDILNMVEVTINVDGITFYKTPSTIFLAQININNEQTLNIDDAIDPKIQEN